MIQLSVEGNAWCNSRDTDSQSENLEMKNYFRKKNGRAVEKMKDQLKKNK